MAVVARWRAPGVHDPATGWWARTARLRQLRSLCRRHRRQAAATPRRATHGPGIRPGILVVSEWPEPGLRVEQRAQRHRARQRRSASSRCRRPELYRELPRAALAERRDV